MNASARLRKLARESGINAEIADALIDIASEAARVGRVEVAEGPVISLDAACQLAGCGKTRGFALLKGGVFQRAPSAGRRTMVTRESVDAYLSGNAEQAQP